MGPMSTGAIDELEATSTWARRESDDETVPTGRDVVAVERWRFGGSRPVHLAIGFALLLPIALAMLFPMLVGAVDPTANVGPPLSPPNLTHFFGTDDLGRDVFSGVVMGARTSLLVGGGAAVISIAFGLIVGLAAGYLGGLVDNGLTRFTELVLVLPRFFVALLIVTLFGASLLNVCLVLGLTGWPVLARIVRVETLSYREREHVLAAMAIGCSHLQIVVRHILPFVRRPVIAVAAPIITAAIVTEAGLSYLGLSDPNWVSWGKLIQNGQAFVQHGWWLSFFPGLALVATCIGIALVLDAVQGD